MKFTDYLKKLVMDYFIIFAIIVITITVLRQIFVPNEYLRLKDIFIYMICALVGDLPSLIFYSPKELSEKQMRLRIVIHFVVLEAAILVLANAAGWATGVVNTVVLAVQVAVIYIVVRVLRWTDDRRSANSINERLKEMKYELTEVLEEE